MAASRDDSAGLARSVTRAARSASPDRAMQRLLDDERNDTGSKQRSALVWRDRVDREAMTLRGVLRSASESGALARCVLHNGTIRHATIGSVGIDVVELHDRNGQHVLVALGRLRAIRLPGTRLIAAEGEPSVVTLHSCLVALADDQADVRIHVDGGQDELGLLAICGVDVIVLRTATRDHVYIPLDAISEVVVIAR